MLLRFEDMYIGKIEQKTHQPKAMKKNALGFGVLFDVVDLYFYDLGCGDSTYDIELLYTIAKIWKNDCVHV